eukprot:gene15609-17181_t
MTRRSLSIAENNLTDLKGDNNCINHQGKPQQPLKKESPSQSISVQFTSDTALKQNQSRTFISSIEPMYLKKRPNDIAEVKCQVESRASFSPTQVQRIVNNVLESYVKEAEYDEKTEHGNTETASFKVNDSVHVKAGEQKSGLDCNHWLGPYQVIEIVSQENVKLNMGNPRRYPIVNVNRLKLDKSDNLEAVSKSVERMLDKTRTRNEKGRSETKYL